MTKKYRVVFNKRYLKDLKTVPKKIQAHIHQAVLDLSHDPRPSCCKKLQGQKKDPLYRIRCGDYRIVYTIQDDILLVLVIEIGHRRSIYQKT